MRSRVVVTAALLAATVAVSGPLPAGLVGDQSAASALCERIADRLGAEVSVNAWGGRGLLRLSAQVYNRAGEYDRFAGRLAALLADG